MSAYSKLLDLVIRTPAIRVPFKYTVVKVARLGNDDFYKRMLSYSVLGGPFRALAASKRFADRQALWDAVLQSAPETPIAYVEFGVHQGVSIAYAAERNRHAASRFVGLDSFEGLPENWGEVERGTFSTAGKLPQIDDRRVSFIRGWFQDTWLELRPAIPLDLPLIVHYDADLYSSTLFALCQIDQLKVPYVAIFDEFSGHECAALFNYLESFCAQVEFLGFTTLDNSPLQVWCKIVPKPFRTPAGENHSSANIT